MEIGECIFQFILDSVLHPCGWAAWAIYNTGFAFMSLEFNLQLRKHKYTDFDQLQGADSSSHKSYYTIIGVLLLFSISVVSIYQQLFPFELLFAQSHFVIFQCAICMSSLGRKRGFCAESGSVVVYNEVSDNREH